MTKNKILIVEDERITAEDLKNTLENMGYEVTGMASSADTFYKSLNAVMPDLVLMDIFLKGNKDGIELATEVREKFQLPVIYLTAYSDTNILDRAKVTEPFGYILKPFQERELHSNIEMALHKNRMELRINHLNAILKAIRDVNQLIMRVDTPDELLTKTCDTLISTRAYSSAWFMTLDSGGSYLDAASAGIKENFDAFIKQFRAGTIPKCLKYLEENDEKIYALDDCMDCSECLISRLDFTRGIIISKVQYQSRLHGYLAVSLPKDLINDKEELELFQEIADDLGLALNNLEQKNKKLEAEEALRISEEKFRALYQNAPMSYQSLDDNGCFIDINPTWEKTLGYTREEVIGKWYGDFLHPDYVEHFRINFPAFKKRGSISGVQFKLRKKSGDYIHVSFDGCIGYYPDGSFRQTYCVFKDITEQQKAEENLKNSEEQLRILINAMPDLVCFKDGKGRWLVANDYAIKLFGLQGVDYFGKTDSELAEYNSFYRQAFSECEATDAIAWEKRVPNRSDKTILRPDGTIMIFDSIKIPNFDANGKPKGMVVVERDITERKTAEQELQKLSQVVLQSPESIVVTNTKGIIEYANPAACLISGYTSAELIGKNPRVLKSGETSAEEYKVLWKTIKSGKEWKGEFHNRKKNGELYWERASVSPIKNPDGEITHFLGIKEDITERKHSEGLQKVLFNISKHTHETGELKQLFIHIKDELNQLFDTTNFYVAFYDESTGMLNAVYASDENDTITEWPAEKSLTGYVIKHNKSVLFKHEDFKKLVETGELELIGIDSEVWLGVPLTVDGKTYGAIVIQDYHDPDAYSENDLKMLEFIASQISLSIQRQKSILDLHDAFVKAEASDKLKTAFINNISHEIRTPLNGILGFTEMSLNPDTTPEDHELFFTVIKKSSKRLLNTITSYMDISMLVSGTMEISRRPSNLDKLIKEINADFSEISVSKGIELKVVKPDLADPLILNTDIEKLRKILTHLLDNAFKFTLKGTVSFGYEIKDTEFEFYVSDTGTGIKTNLLNVIFDAFMQADVSSTRGYEGSGLGLTIANGLVKLLGGNLRIDTERGKGSVFYFTLPFSENTILTPQKTVDIPKPAETESKPLILIAEDDDSNYKYIEIVLMYSSYRVMRAENGIEAVDCLRKNPDVSLVLMDIKMPLMDGFEATKQIRTFMPNIPIIALTAHVTAEDESLAISSGCNEYVTKPVSKAKLLEIIEDSLALN
jgi:PAS domain S-box-containing protein